MSALFPRNSKVTVDADGIHVEPDDTAGNDPRTAFLQRLSDAWRGSDRTLTNTLDHIKRKQQISQAWRGNDAEPGDAPEAAYAARSASLASAWQNVARAGPTPRAPKPTDPDWITMAGGRRKYRPGIASYDPAGDRAGDAMTAFDDGDADAQAQRDAANAKYVDRIVNAWRKS